MIDNILYYKYIKYKNKYINLSKYGGGYLKPVLSFNKCDINCVRCKKNIKYKNNIFLSNCMHICCRTCLFYKSIYLLEQEKDIYIIYLIRLEHDKCVCGKSIKQYNSLIGDTWIINNENAIKTITINGNSYTCIMYKHTLDDNQLNFIKNYKSLIKLSFKFFILHPTLLSKYIEAMNESQ